jgi:hypothetical protein
MEEHMAEKQKTSKVKKDPFAELKSLDGLKPGDGLGSAERKFLAGLAIAFAGNDIFCGNETAQRFTIALDLADRLNEELRSPGATIEFMFRPYAQEDDRIRPRGEPFLVRIERAEHTAVPQSQSAGATDPCCMWKWDPILKRFICVAMC